jgi:hypothetical protein
MSLRLLRRCRARPAAAACSRVRLLSSSGTLPEPEPDPEPVLVNIGGVRAAVPHRSPQTPARVPMGYIGADPERLPREQLAQLRWLMQKSTLGEDVFLIGPPGRSRRALARGESGIESADRCYNPYRAQ